MILLLLFVCCKFHTVRAFNLFSCNLLYYYYQFFSIIIIIIYINICIGFIIIQFCLEFIVIEIDDVYILFLILFVCDCLMSLWFCTFY